MTGDPLEQLRAEASRADYASMARLARALYATGLRSRQVLRECYGVEFPEEFLVTAGERLPRSKLLANFTNQPWKIGKPANQGGPPAAATELTEENERRIFARDPDLMPLMELIGHGTRLEDMMICYRQSGLRAGSTTIFGVRTPVAPDGQVEECGESLLAVLHAHHVAYLRHKEWIIRQPWERGEGSYSQRDVDSAAALVSRVEALQRQADASGR
jgi:hypothetical protein